MDALFVRAEPKFIPRPQYYCSPHQQWAPLPNLTMLGDAAYIMPPHAGEGVNLAMHDACELAGMFARSRKLEHSSEI